MSYDIYLKDPVTKEVLELDEKHDMKGGTYCLGGTKDAHLNITWNYAPFYYKWIDSDEGIRSIYGKTGRESIPILEFAIENLSDDVDPDYWQPTEGNAKRALLQLLALARMRPDGIWDVD